VFVLLDVHLNGRCPADIPVACAYDDGLAASLLERVQRSGASTTASRKARDSSERQHKQAHDPAQLECALEDTTQAHKRDRQQQDPNARNPERRPVRCASVDGQ
jgi:hypothetical protein